MRRLRISAKDPTEHDRHKVKALLLDLQGASPCFADVWLDGVRYRLIRYGTIARTWKLERLN